MLIKNKWKILLLILLLTLTASFLISCGSVDSISVSEMPQLTYARGQDLNLDDGVLKINKGKKTSEISLSSDEISVTGYDKNKLGEQTVTFEYDGATTSITVTVVDRIVVSNATTDYLVGDSFDKTKGKVTLTLNDGTTRAILLSSGEVTVSGFDSSIAKKGADVKVVCNTNGEIYEGSFKVNIHPVDSVIFNQPSRISYGSHYSGKIDLSGGYFTLKGNNGKNTREVAITENMVSGFDVSAVNSENKDIDQTITVTYNGVAYTYDIKLTYTDISKFIDNKEAFNSVDWNGENLPAIEKDLGELAFSLMSAYLEMSSTDQALINQDDVFNVARAAMVYGFEIWAENIKQFKGAFAIEYGEIAIYCESYETVKNAISLFEKKDSAIYKVAPVLLGMIDLYGDSVVYENETTKIMFSSYPVMDEDAVVDMHAMLIHFVEIFDTIKTIPDNWQASDLSAYSTTIETVYSAMLGESYATTYPNVYALVSYWRTNDDLFDILYNYLYEANYKDSIPYLFTYGLPTAINELYGFVFNAVLSMNNIQSLAVKDTTNLFYNFYRAKDCANKLKAQTETMENYVYLNLPLNFILGIPSSQVVTFDDMIDFIRSSEYGFYHLSSGLLDLPEYDAFMNKYIVLLTNIMEIEDYDKTAQYGEDIKALFNLFVDFSPAQQYDLLATLNSLYSIGIPELAFDDSEENIKAGNISLFTVLVNKFMRSTLSEAHTETYNNLILAIEVYANRFGYDNWKNDFTSRMDKVAAALINMSTEDRQNFEYYLGAAYKKYVAIKEKVTSDTAADLGEWADDFAMLNDALLNVQTASNYLYIDKYNYSYFLASFERAAKIVENILKNAPKNVIDAYYHEALFEFAPADSEAGTAAVNCSYDSAVSLYRNTYINILVFFYSSNTTVNMYEAYNERKMGEFLGTYYDMVNAFLNKKQGDAHTFDKATVLNVMKQFRLLSPEAKSFFMLMEGNINIYHNALELFISQEFTANAAAVAIKLYSLEQCYLNYHVSQNDVTLNSMKAVLNQLKELYTALEGEDKTSFEALEEAYSYYVEKCEAIINPTNAA